MSIRIRNDSGIIERVAGFSDVDSILSPDSTNPIQNRSVYNALEQKIDKTVNDLVEYYTKADVYNKSEVRELIGAINTLTIEVVASLPTQDISATTIYFVGPAASTNTYDEYVYVNNTWVKIGDTDIDLSGYVTSAQLTTALQSYCTTDALNAILLNFYDKTSMDARLNAKQDILAFDNSPTSGSTNPVKSGGIYTALAGKQATLTFDSTPTDGSSNPVTSDGIYDALAGKQATLTFDSNPKTGSANPVTSAGIKSAIDAIPSGIVGRTTQASGDTTTGHFFRFTIDTSWGSNDYLIELSYFGYGSRPPAKLLIQGYCYQNTLLSSSNYATWLGYNGTQKVTVYKLNDNTLGVYINSDGGYWCGFCVCKSNCYKVKFVSLENISQANAESKYGYSAKYQCTTVKSTYTTIS